MIDVFSIVEEFRRRTGLARDGSFIEMNRSGGFEPAVALLIFAAGDPAPVAFVKAVAGTEKTERVRREYDNLTLLHERGSAQLRAGVPKPLYCEPFGGLVVLAESATPGTRMKDFPPDAYFRSGSFRGHFTAVGKWLEQFHASVSPEGPAPDAAEAIARYREAYRVSPALDRLLEESAERCAGRSLPHPASHGDFCTANVVIGDDDRVFVIDWEYPLTPGWPLADLLYFVNSTWCVPYRKGPQALERNFRRLFFETHAFAQPIREMLTAHAATLELESELLLPLSVLCWVAYANRKRRELGDREDPAHMPLIMVRDGACSNLELLAANRERYLRAP